MRLAGAVAVASLLATARPASADMMFIEEISCEDGGTGWPCVAGTEIGDTLDRATLWTFGVGDAPHDQAAARAAGASVQRGAGVAFAGASALENRWSVDGVPIESSATGGAGMGIPIEFLDRIVVTSGGMGASARASTGAVIDAHLVDGRSDEMQVRFDFRQGTPARLPRDVPDRFDPLTLEFDPVQAWGPTAVTGAPIRFVRGYDAWMVLGFAFTAFTDDATRVARRLRDADGDGLYDRRADRTLETDVIERRHVDNPAITYAMMLRAGASRGKHGLILTGLATGYSQQRLSADGTAEATDVTQVGGGGIASAAWTTRWARTQLDVTAAWRREVRTEDGLDEIQIGTADNPPPADLPDDLVLAEACDDAAAGDPYPGVVNCPVPEGYFVRGGGGSLTDAITDTPSVTAALTRRWRNHRFELGATGEDARRVVTRRFTGGVLERRLAETIVITSRYVEDGLGDFVDASVRTYRTRYLAAWLEDRWRPVRGLDLRAGLRWESMEVGTTLRFRDELAPRFGASFDPTRRGRARLFAAFARYFAWLPPGFGPSVLGDARVHTHLEAPVGNSDVLEGGGASELADDLRAPHTDEVIAGAEWVGLDDRIDVGFAIQQRSLWRGMEDAAGTLTAPGARRDVRETRLWLGNAPDARLRLRAVWVRTRARGNWAGVYDPLEGATLYRSGFDGTTANAYGRLPLDLPHRFFLEVAGTTHRVGLDWDIGARFQLTSGSPVSAFAGPRGEIPLLPRGDAGRVPTSTAVLLHVAARRRSLELSLDILDLFDRRGPASVDERWTTDGDVAPIEGGTSEDLLWVRDVGGGRVRQNPGYGVANRYLAPVVLRVAVRARF